MAVSLFCRLGNRGTEAPFPKHFQNLRTQEGEGTSGWSTGGDGLQLTEFGVLVIALGWSRHCYKIFSFKPGGVNNDFYSRATGNPESLLETASGDASKGTCCLRSVLSLVHGKR